MKRTIPCTASHSLVSSPSGSWTDCRRLPEPYNDVMVKTVRYWEDRLTSVASAYFRSWYCLVPSGTSLRGLNVRVLPLCISCVVIMTRQVWATGCAYRLKNEDMRKAVIAMTDKASASQATPPPRSILLSCLLCSSFLLPATRRCLVTKRYVLNASYLYPHLILSYQGLVLARGRPSLLYSETSFEYRFRLTCGS